MNTPSFGAHESPIDSRNVQHTSTMSGVPLVSGGYDYLPQDILDQYRVGKCTAISLIQNRNKANGKKYSYDFQYLLQKRLEGNWTEGSSLSSALKIGNKIGFLPAELWTWTTDADSQVSYETYIAKLQTIPEGEVQRLIALCMDKIPGYAAVNVSDPQALASAIVESECGILCRYLVGSEWYTSVSGAISWNPADIDPLRAPVVPISGHAIGMTKFDYSTATGQILANTWGTEWDKQGIADILWEKYKPTEAWLILKTAPSLPLFQFQHDLYAGITSPDVIQLQIILNKNPQTQVAETGAGSPGHETNFFGALTFAAVEKFQKLYNINPVAGYVGPLTRAKLNSLI